MTVHAIHIFDRKGKTLFTKRYTSSRQSSALDAEQLSEQRKLIFGMLFSLRELVGSLSPEDGSPGMCERKIVGCPLDSVMRHAHSLNCSIWIIASYQALQSVRTGAGTLHCFETISGLRIALYTNNNPIMTPIGARAPGADTTKTSFQTALKYIYSDIWVECVVRSPLYRPEDIQVGPTEGNKSCKFDIKSTNFETKLDAYLASMPWFR